MKDKDMGRKGDIQKSSGRRMGNNTMDNQRAADNMNREDKGKQQQGNNGSRQGDGGNRGRRGNTGLG